jgi:phosphatidylinositol alpha-1,6-mannosyltransferase
VAPLFQAVARAQWQRVDVVHCGDLFPQGLIALFLKRVGGFPYVAFCHGEEIAQTDRFRYQPSIRNRIYLSADAVIANADYARNRLLKIGVASDRIHKITPGVDCDVFSPGHPDSALQDRFGLRNRFVLLTVARLVPRKGHDMVLKAIAKLAGQFPLIRYLIIGRGPEELKLRQLAADMGIAEKVVFAGFIPDSQLPACYRLSDLVVMPNREHNGDLEGFGITFLEASATAKPVIAGESGGAPEAVAQGVSGELVAPTNLERLVAVIRSFLVDRGKAESMGMAGLQRARAEFDWKKRAQELRSITRSVAGRKQKAVGAA